MVTFSGKFSVISLDEKDEIIARLQGNYVIFTFEIRLFLRKVIPVAVSLTVRLCITLSKNAVLVNLIKKCCINCKIKNIKRHELTYDFTELKTENLIIKALFFIKYQSYRVQLCFKPVPR